MALIYIDGIELIQSNTRLHQRVPLRMGPDGKAIIFLHLPPIRGYTDGPAIAITVRTRGHPCVKDVGKALNMALGTRLRPQVVQYYYPRLHGARSLPALRLVDIFSRGIQRGETIGFALHVQGGQGGQPENCWLTRAL